MTRFLSRDRVFILAFLLPIIVVVFALIYVPAADTLQTSLTNENLRIRKPAEFVGLDNYIRLLTDDEFWEVTLRSILLVLIVLPLEIIIAFAAALLLNEHFPGRGIVRGLVLIPWLVPPVVNGFLWGWILNGDFGALNGLLYQLGIINEYQFWLREPTNQIIWVAIVQTWTRFAFPMIILLAGMQGIPSELYDAAKVDGANVIGRLRHVTIPSMRASIAIVLVLEFIAAFQIFDIVWTLTSGGSTGGTINPFTKTLMVFNYELVFRDLRVGLGAALSYLVLLMSLGVGIAFIVRLYNQGVKDK
ncbi:MAG: sugar ABC transporter permease [Chloroflexota bacterium]|nr:sugar ABC transporter permease [Chloroflexota bacterium]